MYQITISVDSNNQLSVAQDDRPISLTEPIKFTTADKSRTYSIIIDNYDLFFAGSKSILIYYVTSKTPVSLNLTEAAKVINVKYYSVGVIYPSVPVPLPPAAPPRIVITKPTP